MPKAAKLILNAQSPLSLAAASPVINYYRMKNGINILRSSESMYPPFELERFYKGKRVLLLPV